MFSGWTFFDFWSHCRISWYLWLSFEVLGARVGLIFDLRPVVDWLFLRFCRTWTKRYLITSQTRVKRVSRIHHRIILQWCIRLTRLTLVCKVIRYRLVQVRQNLKKKKTFRVGGSQSPFSISSSFILFFVLLPFFLNTKMSSRLG